MDKNNLENTLPENEYTTFEERVYGNPNLQVDETNTFIDKLRETQRQNNAEIASQTRNLGTQVPSNLGGLTGGQGYWTSRYQTPQTNSAVATLKEAARAAALKEALANEKAVWDKRYKDTYRAYQKRQSDKQNAGTTGQTIGGVDYNDNTENVVIEGSTPGQEGYYTVANIDTDNGTVLGYTGVPYGEEYKTNYKYNLGDQPKDNFTGLDWETAAHVKSGIWDDGWFKAVYTLPSGKEVKVDARNEELVRGKQGGYYLHDKSNSTYNYVGE